MPEHEIAGDGSEAIKMLSFFELQEFGSKGQGPAVTNFTKNYFLALNNVESAKFMYKKSTLQAFTERNASFHYPYKCLLLTGVSIIPRL